VQKCLKPKRKRKRIGAFTRPRLGDARGGALGPTRRAIQTERDPLAEVEKVRRSTREVQAAYRTTGREPTTPYMKREEKATFSIVLPVSLYPQGFIGDA
jgi:hypothetical protein